MFSFVPGDESAFPRLGSSLGDNRQKSLDIQLQDNRQQRSESSQSPVPAGTGQVSSQASIQGSKPSSMQPTLGGTELLLLFILYLLGYENPCHKQ